MKVATLRPGILVALRTSVRGGVSYSRQDLEAEENGTGKTAKWETTKTVEDPQEFEAASKVRGKARALISSVCASSDFGLLCPEDMETRLNAAVVAAQAMVTEFNECSTRTRVEISILKGRIASNDAEAMRAINSEVRELMESMQRGIASADVETIREAASKAKSLGAMLTPEAALKVNTAIEQAREAARELVKRLAKGGEAASEVVAQLRIEAITDARFTFLDMDDVKEVEPLPIAGRALDMSETTTASPVSAPQPAIEMA